MTTLILSIFFSISSSAYDVMVDGIYYNIVTKAKTAEVTEGDNEYSGDVTIPETITVDNVVHNVTSIGDYAFEECSSLTSITIPNSVTSIRSGAFSRCYEIENVYCYAETVPSTKTDAFSNSYIEDATLHVPESAINAYITTEPCSGFGTFKTIEGTVGIESVEARSIAIQSADGFITISGLDSNEQVDFFATDGKALGSAKSMGGTATFAAQSGSVVVAKIGKESVKIAVK